PGRAPLDDLEHGPRRPDRDPRDPVETGRARPQPRDLRHAHDPGHLRPRDVRDLVSDVGDARVRPRHQPGHHAPLLVRRLRGGVCSRPLRRLREGDHGLDEHLMYGSLKDELAETLASLRGQGTYKSELVMTTPQGAHVEVEGRGTM